jgi:hypothetical protein
MIRACDASQKSPKLYKSNYIYIINWCGPIPKYYYSVKETRRILMTYFEKFKVSSSVNFLLLKLKI